MSRIEDYGFIGNMVTGALVGRDGSIDWLCLPEFDDDACFAALLGRPEHGHWKIAPDIGGYAVKRQYRKNTAILETTFESDKGSVTVTDFMPIAEERDRVDLIRIVRCDRGQVNMQSRLALRFDYGEILPWVQKSDAGIIAIAGPDAIQFQSDVPLRGQDMMTWADFMLKQGEQKGFCLTWFPSHLPAPLPIVPDFMMRRTERWWQEWAGRASDFDRWNDAVIRSLITLKTLTFRPTGAIVAAPTASLPEKIGGERNWDYRYCWIRDSTLTLYAFLISGYTEEAKAWRHWLLRAAAGDPAKLQIMYGLHGERRLTELELPWLPGYEGSKPVRIGNEAYTQMQLDVYGELMDTLHVARKFKLEPFEEAWRMQKAFVDFVGRAWREPDFGLWEMRGPAQHFTHSKIMAWVVFDRAIKAVDAFGLDGPIEEWRATAAEIHEDVCRNGIHPEKGCFVQTYGGKTLDASLLLIAQLGFIPANDPRFIKTVEAVERELISDGFVLRYRTEEAKDGLSPGEGAFLACSFWLVDAYVLIGRYDDAVALLERLLSLRNDLGLLAEEYNAAENRQIGNFPQAFSHIALINSVHNLTVQKNPAQDRADGKAGTGTLHASTVTHT